MVRQTFDRSMAKPSALVDNGMPSKTSEPKETGAESTEIDRVTHNSVFASPHQTRARLPESHFPSKGGIAQLVERQLCKLDVRGSNPLASTCRFPGFPNGPVAQLVRACA